MTGFQYSPEISLEEADKAYDITNQVMELYQKRGFTIPPCPQYVDQGAHKEYDGSVPFDLTTLSDKQLGFYLSMLTSWMNYVGHQKCLADMAKTVAKQKLEFVESKIRLQNKYDEEGKKRSNPERDDVVNCDRRVVEARSAFMQLDAYCTMVNQVYKNAEHNYAAVSRRVTQRVSETEKGNRTGNVGSMPHPAGQQGHPLYRGGR